MIISTDWLEIIIKSNQQQDYFSCLFSFAGEYFLKNTKIRCGEVILRPSHNYQFFHIDLIIVNKGRSVNCKNINRKKHQIPKDSVHSRLL